MSESEEEKKEEEEKEFWYRVSEGNREGMVYLPPVNVMGHKVEFKPESASRGTKILYLFSIEEYSDTDINEKCQEYAVKNNLTYWSRHQFKLKMTEKGEITDEKRNLIPDNQLICLGLEKIAREDYAKGYNR